MAETGALRAHELALQRAVTAWIVTGLTFMLLPGTFLGVWNLIDISGQHTAARIDPSWIQAHGHAQVFGWIGSFILGIGFYSLSKMAGSGRIAVRDAWLRWAPWTAGVACAGRRTCGSGNGAGCRRYRRSWSHRLPAILPDGPRP